MAPTALTRPGAGRGSSAGSIQVEPLSPPIFIGSASNELHGRAAAGLGVRWGWVAVGVWCTCVQAPSSSRSQLCAAVWPRGTEEHRSLGVIPAGQGCTGLAGGAGDVAMPWGGLSLVALHQHRGVPGCCCAANANPDLGWAGGSAFPSTRVMPLVAMATAIYIYIFFPLITGTSKQLSSPGVVSILLNEGWSLTHPTRTNPPHPHF